MTIELPRSVSDQPALAIARRCAQEAGRIMSEGFGRAQRVEWKGRGNVVTAVDLLAEQAVIAILASEYPDHAVLSEETQADQRSDGWLWVIDPLDGSRNYASGIPNFCFNLALCHQGTPLLGLTHDPMRQEEFLAIKGGGAFLNGQPLKASTKPSVAAAVVGLEMGYKDERGKHLLALMHHLWPGMQSLRIIGSAALALAYAAAGRYDLFIHHDMMPWDIAPGILMTQEAGGAISDRDGGPVSIYSEGVIAGGPQVHADFLRLAAGWPWR